MTLGPVLSRIDADLPQALDRLMHLLRIPSISTDPAYAADGARAADWLAADLRTIGFEAASRPTPGRPKGHPVLGAGSSGAGRMSVTIRDATPADEAGAPFGTRSLHITRCFSPQG